MNSDPSPPDEPVAPQAPMAPEGEEAENLPALPRPTGQVCGNCGTPTYGEYCYHCGQPDHGLVRHFSSVMGDLLDTVLQIDTRLTRTLAPLLLRPGYLSIEYFAGRRVRYVSPVRLFFFVAVIAFFVAQWSVDASGNGSQFVQVDKDAIESATTVEAVQAERDRQLKELQAGLASSGKDLGAVEKEARREDKVRQQAEERIVEITAAKAAGKPPPDHQADFDMGNGPWDPVKNPIQFDSLPKFANVWLNQMAGQAKGNFARIQKNPILLVDAWLSAMPSTLFVMLPLFAALLKLVYFFKRRLYMEHFIVALHSHAFLCFDLLLMLVCDGLERVAPSVWMRDALEFVKFVLILWMPLYLLLMQKKVYAQGWIMTSLKYFAVGMVYFMLLTFGVIATFAVKLVWL